MTLVILYMISILSCLQAFRLNSNSREILSNSCSFRINSLILNAKKKGPKLISDDLLSVIDSNESVDVAVDVKPIKPNEKKESKGSNKFVSTDLLTQIDSEFNEPLDNIPNSSIITKNKDKKKDKKSKQSGIIIDEEKDIIDESINDSASFKEHAPISIDKNEDVNSEVVIDSAITIEQKIRKERPPSRVRFAESSQPDFVMMALDKVSLIFGNNVVLKNASFSVQTGERVGLVGQNGGGKTTQLKILSGELEPTTGDVVKSSRNLRISFLRQEFIDDLDLSKTLRNELLNSFKEEKKILSDITECEEELANTTDDPEKMETVLNRMQVLQEQAISKGVYSLDSKVDKIMDSMGFSSSDSHSLVSTFSGGWKMRIGLAKILLQDPNILLLDEPTNHLDLDSVYWLEDFLVKQNIPMVIVSHDREFLDRVCNKIVEVEDGITYTYLGNYSKYLDQRRVRLEVWRDQYEKQTRYIKEEEAWIKKAKNDPNLASQVRSKEIALEKFKASEEYIPQPPKEKKFRFRFPPSPRCGASVIEVSNVCHGFGNTEDKKLFENVDLQVSLGDRVGFVGPNGSGKSTLMRIIVGTEKPLKGYSDFGSRNVEFNYFEQNQADALDLDKTVLQTVMESAPEDYTITEIRTLLGQFMFKGDDAEKKIRFLSGGEKARVSLCKMMLTPANLLLLDEPTNHLDITSKEVLEEALQHFEGAVMVISHDRYFMSQVVNKIYSFENKTIVRYDTDYHDYMELKGEGFKEKVTNRYVDGDKYKITNAKPVIVEEKQTKRNFGGSGVTSGNLNKGIKNAKRYQ